MKHSEMLPLMGQIVTVKATLRRRYYKERTWVATECRPWAGWIVGFRHMLNGTVSYSLEEGAAPEFRETSRQPCVMVAPWPQG